MELLVFGHSGQPVLMYPTRMARFYDYENWGVIGALESRLAAGDMQIFCVDSIDAESFYNENIQPAERIQRHVQYETYIIDEVLPFMERINGNDDFFVAGCSMGAFHAVNTAFRHPEFFVKVVAMSGRYDLTVEMGDFRDLFSGYRSQEVYFNTPLQFVANLNDQEILGQLRNLDITIVIGEADQFYQNNQNFSEVLNYKDIPHNLYVWDDYAHKARYWRQMVQLYF